MNRVEIGRDEQLYPGDVVELHFTVWGPDWFKAAEAAIIESAVKGRDDFELVSANYWEPEKVILTVKVIEPQPKEPGVQRAGIVVSIAVILGALAITAVAFGWMFDKAYKITDSPAGTVGSIGFAAVGIGAVLLLLLLLKKK